MSRLSNFHTHCPIFVRLVIPGNSDLAILNLQFSNTLPNFRPSGNSAGLRSLEE